MYDDMSNWDVNIKTDSSEKRLKNELLKQVQLNGGFLKKFPLNNHIKVRCHVYLIKSWLLNLTNFMGKFDPYVSIELEEKEIDRIKLESFETYIGK